MKREDVHRAVQDRLPTGWLYLGQLDPPREAGQVTVLLGLVRSTEDVAAILEGLAGLADEPVPTGAVRLDGTKALPTAAVTEEQLAERFGYVGHTVERTGPTLEIALERAIERAFAYSAQQQR